MKSKMEMKCVDEEIMLTIADAFLGLNPRCPSLVPFGCILSLAFTVL